MSAPVRLLPVVFAALMTALTSACGFDATSPEPDRARDPARVLGVIELTFTGIGTSAFTSSARVAATMSELEALRAMHPGVVGIETQDLVMPADSSGGRDPDGQIQIRKLNTQTTVIGGVRYLRATYAVRNGRVHAHCWRRCSGAPRSRSVRASSQATCSSSPCSASSQTRRASCRRRCRWPWRRSSW